MEIYPHISPSFETRNDEHPLRQLEGLSIAVVGAAGSGKSSLVADLVSTSLVPVVPPQPSEPIRNPIELPALVTHILRSAPALVVRNLWLQSHRALHRRLQVDKFKLHVIETGGRPVAIYEAIGEHGVHGIGEATYEYGGVHLVLFCTRLDESRAITDERMQLMTMFRNLGPDSFMRTLVVFTHGCARPPFELDFRQFVRGRRDLLWLTIKQIVPPTRRGDPHLFCEQAVTPSMLDLLDEDEEETVTFSRMMRLPPWCRKIIERLFPWKATSSTNEEQVGTSGGNVEGGQVGDESGSGDKMVDMLRNIPAVLDNVDTSLHFMEQLDQADVIQPEEDLEEYALYEDPPPPEVAVVELSGLCPTNADGERVLPDGTPWFDTLVKVSASRAKRDDVVACDERDRKEKEVKHDGVMGVVKNFIRARWGDPRVQLLLRLLLLSGLARLGVLGVSAYADILKKRKEEEPRHLIMECDEDEYNRLTSVDEDEGIEVFEIDDGTELKEKQDEKGEFSKTLEDAEIEFFGSKQSEVDSMKTQTRNPGP